MQVTNVPAGPEAPPPRPAVQLQTRAPARGGPSRPTVPRPPVQATDGDGDHGVEAGGTTGRRIDIRG